MGLRFYSFGNGVVGVRDGEREREIVCVREREGDCACV